MTPAALARFNTRKAAVHRALWPATVTFARDSGVSHSVCFGETDDDGGLHESGVAISHHRTGVLEFTLGSAAADYRPDLAHTFTITAAAQQPQLVGLRFQVSRIISTAGEPVLKCLCRRMEE